MLLSRLPGALLLSSAITAAGVGSPWHGWPAGGMLAAPAGHGAVMMAVLASPSTGADDPRSCDAAVDDSCQADAAPSQVDDQSKTARGPGQKKKKKKKKKKKRKKKAPAAALGFGVHWFGPFWSGGGYSSEAIAFAGALDPLVSLQITHTGDTPDREFAEGLPDSTVALLRGLSRQQPGGGASESVAICHSEPGSWNVNGGPRYNVPLCTSTSTSAFDRSSPIFQLINRAPPHPRTRRVQCSTSHQY